MGLSSNYSSGSEELAAGRSSPSPGPLVAECDAPQAARAAGRVVTSAMQLLHALAGPEFCADFAVIAQELAQEAFEHAQCVVTERFASDEAVVDAVLANIERSGAVERAIDRLFDLTARLVAGPAPVPGRMPVLLVCQPAADCRA